MNATAKTTAKEKTAINKALGKLCSKYFPSIPLEEIQSIFSPFDLKIEEGIYCGREGESLEPIGRETFMRLTWYKLESGNFEIVAYVC